MLPEETVREWEKLPLQARREVWKSDAVLCYFDNIHLQDCLEGKNQSFSMEEIIEIQDKLPPAPTGDDATIFDIFGKNGVRSKVARSHKLNKIIEDRFIALSKGGVKAASQTPAVAESMPEQASAPPPQPQPTAAAPQEVKVAEKVTPPADPQDTRNISSALKYLTFAPDMPAEAKINLRKEPTTEAAIMGECRLGTVLTSPTGVQPGKDWAKVYLGGDPNQVAWILVRADNRPLLVECAFPTAGVSEDRENLQAEVNKQAAPQSPTFLPSAKVSRDGIQTKPPPALTPLERGGDGERAVTLAEFNRLRTKVAQLEADLRALRLLLRSA